MGDPGEDQRLRSSEETGQRQRVGPAVKSSRDLSDLRDQEIL